METGVRFLDLRSETYRMSRCCPLRVPAEDTRHIRLLRITILVGVALLMGCDDVRFRPIHGDPQPQPAPQVVQTPARQSASRPVRRDSRRERDESDAPAPKFDVSPSDFSFDMTAGGGGGSFGTRSPGSGENPVAKHTTRSPGLSIGEAAKMVAGLVGDSVDYGPTLIVWLVDRSASAQSMVADFAQQIRDPYENLGAGIAGSPDESPLLTAVVAFGDDVRFVVDPPSPQPGALNDALSNLEVAKSSRESTFAAVRAALEKYLPYRTERRREVIFVVLTDEAGNDAEMVDQLVTEPRRYGMPFYVIGVPAPFGRPAGLAQTAEAPLGASSSGDELAVRQGPESRHSERLQLGFWGGATDLDLLDSGFGPFALERLCRTSGGRFLALRPQATGYGFGGSHNLQWPSAGVYQFDPQVMRRYAPSDTSAADYQALLADNAAAKALHNAAQLEGVQRFISPKLDFTKRSEAEMAVDLANAQQVAAKLEPPLRTLYETLEQGERDRERLTEPRWQAGYDLAMGRASAALARISGYNSMLASLKGGKPFENPSSTVWMLMPADTIETSSLLKRQVEKAQMYLQRVVEEHPGTPWALIAARELQQPIGWEWKER